MECLRRLRAVHSEASTRDNLIDPVLMGQTKRPVRKGGDTSQIRVFGGAVSVCVGRSMVPVPVIIINRVKISIVKTDNESSITMQQIIATNAIISHLFGRFSGGGGVLPNRSHVATSWT